MKKQLLLLIALVSFACVANGQMVPKGFGKGLNFYGKDSSFHIKFGFRFQNLYQGTWNVINDDLGTITDHNSRFLIRRSRLKFNGYAFSPKLKWKLELALTNRDMANGAVTPEMSNASNLVLDAWADWNFFKGLHLRFGQFKLPGNVERVVSSANLQLVDRSLLNSRFNIDRDIGVILWNKHKVAGNFYMKEKFGFTQGEGRNVTRGSFDGYNYTGRVEFYPLGLFKGDKDDYVGSAMTYYNQPKLMMAIGHNINENAVRTRGQLGDFITDASGDYVGKQQNTLLADAVMKYKRFSFMGEYAYKEVAGGNPNVEDNNGNVVGAVTTGEALNLQAGIMLNKKLSPMTGDMELVGRLTTVDFFTQQNDENQYTIGINRFVSSHQLKVQCDLTYRDIKGANDGVMFRTQLDVHF